MRAPGDTAVFFREHVWLNMEKISTRQARLRLCGLVAVAYVQELPPYISWVSSWKCGVESAPGVYTFGDVKAFPAGLVQ